jgi:hypothetical protein
VIFLDKLYDMTGVITGDIIRSQKVRASLWLDPLKAELVMVGTQPAVWEIFRGDSFQLEVDPVQALGTAIRIKAAIRRVKQIDVRLSVGIGDKTHHSARITECNGSAFVRSGELFERLERERVNLAVATADPEFDREMNLLLRLALVIMDDWSVNSAETVWMVLHDPGKSQRALGDQLHIRQNAVSARLKRARFAEIAAVISHYEVKMKGMHP